MDHIQTAIRDLTAAETLLMAALKQMNKVKHIKSVELHCKIIDIREIIEILQDDLEQE
ncbi:hypothetical protein [Brevibacillus massiliensis]|jgi:aminoglycoside N3'-acetyltransferase|uniref:hypothetical protein n=1 Tax=Brevibacillus massiliensis TaxID=1118054 RepID=UPI0002F30099|nr:hypothetical protein [Brevibacillus massiliensis]